MDYRRMTAPCGLDCFNCIMYLANENEEVKMGLEPWAKSKAKGVKHTYFKEKFRL